MAAARPHAAAGEEAKAADSYTYAYPHPALTVDILVVTTGREILLIKRGNPPFKGKWALPGGFVDRGETLQQAAARELEEETSVVLPDGDRMRQLGAFADPGRDPRGWTVTVAFDTEDLLDPSRIHPKAGDDAAEARLFPLEGLPELAFDHAQIVAAWRDAHRAALGLDEQQQLMLDQLNERLRKASMVGRKCD